jgi:hypothetical protein
MSRNFTISSSFSSPVTRHNYRLNARNLQGVRTQKTTTPRDFLSMNFRSKKKGPSLFKFPTKVIAQNVIAL